MELPEVDMAYWAAVAAGAVAVLILIVNLPTKYWMPSRPASIKHLGDAPLQTIGGLKTVFQEAARLSSLKPELDDLGMGLYAVVNDPTSVSDFKKYFKGEVYLDLERRFYGPRERWMLFSGFVRPNSYLAFFRALSNGFKGNMKGEGRLLGGAFVIGPRNQGIVLDVRQADWGDQVSVKAISDSLTRVFGRGRQDNSEEEIEFQLRREEEEYKQQQETLLRQQEEEELEQQRQKELNDKQKSHNLEQKYQYLQQKYRPQAGQKQQQQQQQQQRPQQRHQQPYQQQSRQPSSRHPQQSQPLQRQSQHLDRDYAASPDQYSHAEHQESNQHREPHTQYRQSNQQPYQQSNQQSNQHREPHTQYHQQSNQQSNQQPDQQQYQSQRQQPDNAHQRRPQPPFREI